MKKSHTAGHKLKGGSCEMPTPPSHPTFMGVWGGGGGSQAKMLATETYTWDM